MWKICYNCIRTFSCVFSGWVCFFHLVCQRLTQWNYAFWCTSAVGPFWRRIYLTRRYSELLDRTTFTTLSCWLCYSCALCQLDSHVFGCNLLGTVDLSGTWSYYLTLSFNFIKMNVIYRLLVFSTINSK